MQGSSRTRKCFCGSGPLACLGRSGEAVGLAVLARIASAQMFLNLRGISSQPVSQKHFTSCRSCVNVPVVAYDVASGQCSAAVFSKTVTKCSLIFFLIFFLNLVLPNPVGNFTWTGFIWLLPTPLHIHHLYHLLWKLVDTAVCTSNSSIMFF